MRVDEETHQCEAGATKCGRPAPYGYVCYQCIDDTQARLDEVTPEQRLDLDLIARGEARPANRNKEGGGGGIERRDALNIAVWQLARDIGIEWPRMLPTLHRDPDAAKILHRIHQGVSTAHRLTEAQDESTHTDDYLQWRMSQIRVMRAADLSAWLHHYLGLRVSAARIRKWRERGLIEPRIKSPKGGYSWYHPVDVLRTLDSMEREPAA
ncbi:hypothetical protein [Citricoccus sp. NR2]|uniref:hypothetical protein n=1 Tax=Citricoccus sp. NR2 TaxID=3004095 RepID=UPI0022DCFFE3|nr:hypothetical protein [Citricoccus sp. NR2]WBL18506.1 hypothetical protein O1A05_12160 [Citricoccus sp. NR2]